MMSTLKPPDPNPNCECSHCRRECKLPGSSNTSCKTARNNKAPSNPKQVHSQHHQPEPYKSPTVTVNKKHAVAVCHNIKVHDFSQNQRPTIVKVKKPVAKILIHGPKIETPVETIAQVGFTREVQKSLAAKHYVYCLPLQSYVLPAIVNDTDVFMIGQKSGKTMAYIAAISSLTITTMKKHPNLDGKPGPVSVVLCPTSATCEIVFSIFQLIFTRVRRAPKVTFLTYPLNKLERDHGDIVIAMPAVLVSSLHMNLIKLTRTCHLVLEDADIILKTFSNSMANIFTSVNKMLNLRNYKAKGVQLIVSSGTWTKELEELLKNMNKTPLVCCDDNLEAAIYGKLEIAAHFMQSMRGKKESLYDVIAKYYMNYKTVIVCDNDQILDVQSFLTNNRISSMSLLDDSSQCGVDICMSVWNASYRGQFKVLICSDYILDSVLLLNDAMWLVHYNMPSTWANFTQRFSVLTSRLDSPLKREADKCKLKPRSIFLIDGKCEEQIRKLIVLFDRIGTANSPQYYTSFVRHFITCHEQEKIEVETPFCDSLLTFGSCRKSSLECDWRHVVAPFDLDQPFKNGRLKFRIVVIHDVNQFAIQIREHVDIDGNVRKFYGGSLAAEVTFGENEEVITVKSVVCGKFYVVREDQKWMICEIVDISNAGTKINIIARILHNSDIKLVDAQDIAYPPSHIKVLPLRLLNIVPPFGDLKFSPAAFQKAHAALMGLGIFKRSLTADIYLQVQDTILATNVVETHKKTVLFNLSNFLEKLKVARFSDNPLQLLRRYCGYRPEAEVERKKAELKEESGTLTDVSGNVEIEGTLRDIEEEDGYNLVFDKKGVSDDEGTVKEGNSDSDDFGVNNTCEICLRKGASYYVTLSTIISLDHFYIRLAGAEDKVANLEEEINSSVPSLKPLDLATRGALALAIDPADNAYHRVKIVGLEASAALCFFLDYGNELLVPLSELKILPQRFMAKLQFQAIRCSLYGIKSIDEDSHKSCIDLLYELMFEPNTDIFQIFKMHVYDKKKLSDPNAVNEVVLRYSSNDRSFNEILIDLRLAVGVNDFADDNEDQAQAKKYIGIRPLGTMIYDNEHDFDSEQCGTGPTFSFVPNMLWSQTKSTLTLILQLKLAGSEDFKVNIIKDNIFRFWITLQDKYYDFKFILYKPAKCLSYKMEASGIKIELKKRAELVWPKLSNEHLPKTRYKLGRNKRIIEATITGLDSEEDTMYIEDSESESD